MLNFWHHKTATTSTPSIKSSNRHRKTAEDSLLGKRLDTATTSKNIKTTIQTTRSHQLETPTTSPPRNCFSTVVQKRVSTFKCDRSLDLEVALSERLGRIVSHGHLEMSGFWVIFWPFGFVDLRATAALNFATASLVFLKCKDTFGVTKSSFLWRTKILSSTGSFLRLLSEPPRRRALDDAGRREVLGTALPGAIGPGE